MNPFIWGVVAGLIIMLFAAAIAFLIYGGVQLYHNDKTNGVAGVVIGSSSFVIACGLLNLACS